MAGEKILVVDDNDANLALMTYLLEDEGYEVRSAGDVDAVYAVLREFGPRVILMDVQLPRVDGLEITRRLRADPETRDIIILAVTAYAMKGDEQRVRDAGCDGYVTKPIDTRELPRMLRRHLGDA